MAKQQREVKPRRRAISASVQHAVLKEFNHRCALCGEDRPQVHHIDENPANNDSLNLLPLCPNCHLTDQHNPTAPIDPAKLALFRRFKDPAILTPQFEPLFARTRFLDQLHTITDPPTIKKLIQELVEFVRVLEMGQFYAARIVDLLQEPPSYEVLAFGHNTVDVGRLKADQEQNYRERLRDAQPKVIELVVELLKYQKWTLPQRRRERGA